MITTPTYPTVETPLSKWMNFTTISQKFPRIPIHSNANIRPPPTISTLRRRSPMSSSPRENRCRCHRHINVKAPKPKKVHLETIFSRLTNDRLINDGRTNCETGWVTSETSTSSGSRVGDWSMAPIRIPNLRKCLRVRKLRPTLLEKSFRHLRHVNVADAALNGTWSVHIWVDSFPVNPFLTR